MYTVYTRCGGYGSASALRATALRPGRNVAGCARDTRGSAINTLGSAGGTLGAVDASLFPRPPVVCVCMYVWFVGVCVFVFLEVLVCACVVDSCEGTPTARTVGAGRRPVQIDGACGALSVSTAAHARHKYDDEQEPRVLTLTRRKRC